MSQRRTDLLVYGAGVALLIAFAALVYRAQRPVEGVVPIAWDQATCAHCRMHISAPPFAAQLHTSVGEVLNFDDPGCLLSWAEDHPHERPRQIWFRHHQEARWLSESEVSFAPAQETPMGFGLAAVEAGHPGALSLEAAQAQLAAAQPKERR